MRDGLFWVTDGVYQAAFLVHRYGVVLVDAPASLGPKLLAAVEEVTSAPVTHVVYSHAHKDHIAGAGLVQSRYPKVRIVAHRATLQTLRAAHAEDPADPRPVPTRTFERRLNLYVGGQRLRLSNEGTFHEPGDVVIYAPRQEVLMAVDVVFPGWVPFANLALTKDVRGFIGIHDKMLRLNFSTFIGGHLTRLGTRSDVERAKAYVQDVRNAAAAALASVDFGRIFAEHGPNVFEVFRVYLDEVSSVCAGHVEPAWGDLGGVDVFTRSHCYTMQNFLRLE